MQDSYLKFEGMFSLYISKESPAYNELFEIYVNLVCSRSKNFPTNLDPLQDICKNYSKKKKIALLEFNAYVSFLFLYYDLNTTDRYEKEELNKAPKHLISN